MTLRWADRVLDTSTTTGTGNITVSGTPPAGGYITFSAIPSIVDGDTFYYGIADQSGSSWEVGLGTRVSANVFARTTVLASSNSGSAVNFTSGALNCWVDLPASVVATTGTLTANTTLTSGFSAGQYLYSDGTKLQASTLYEASSIWKFGGTTSSYPSLKRAATALQTRLADDSAFAPLYASTLYAHNTADTTSYARALFDPGLATSGVLTIGTQIGGTITAGTLAKIKLISEGTSIWDYGVTTASTITVAASQNLTKQANFGTATLTPSGSNVSWDVSGAQVAAVTLAGNYTMLAPTNLVNGGTYRLEVIQDGTGSRTLTWNAAFVWPNGIAPVLSKAAGAVDIFTFASDGTYLYGDNGLILRAPGTHDATYTFVPTDTGTVCYHSSASAHTWTIDTNANQPFAVGAVVYLNTGQSSGNVTIAAAGGVTLERADGTTGTGNRTMAAAGYATLWQRAADTWVISGSALS